MSHFSPERIHPLAQEPYDALIADARRAVGRLTLEQLAAALLRMLQQATTAGAIEAASVEEVGRCAAARSLLYRIRVSSRGTYLRASPCAFLSTAVSHQASPEAQQEGMYRHVMMWMRDKPTPGDYYGYLLRWLRQPWSRGARAIPALLIDASS